MVINCPSEPRLRVLRGVNFDDVRGRLWPGLTFISSMRFDGLISSKVPAQGLSLAETALSSSILRLCRLRRSIRRSRMPLALESRIAWLRKRPPPLPGVLWDWNGSSLRSEWSVRPEDTIDCAVSICKASLSLLARELRYSSSTQSPGVGGMLPSFDPKIGGGRALSLSGASGALMDASEEPLTLSDLLVGGGPGGGGGRGIPGSQWLPDGDRFLV